MDLLAKEQERNKRLEEELLAMQKSHARLQGALKSIADVLTPDLRQELTQPSTSGEGSDPKAFEEALNRFEANLQ